LPDILKPSKRRGNK